MSARCEVRTVEGLRSRHVRLERAHSEAVILG